ncbi:hypothetical protein ACTQ5H_09080, partial [Limosilactobacillus reuteri]
KNLSQRKETTLPQQNIALARPANFHYLKCQLDRAQYQQDITLINNFDIDRYISLDVEDKDDMLNTVCDLIDEYGLANIRELKRFVRDYGDKYGLPSMKIINSVLCAHTALVRLYFDAVYQERKYGRSDVNQETGEITKK